MLKKIGKKTAKKGMLSTKSTSKTTEEKEEKKKKQRQQIKNIRETETIHSFITDFTTEKIISEKTTRNIKNYYFSSAEKPPERAVWIGDYLGKVENNKFVPSLSLLRKLLHKSTQWVEVDEKAEWLAICGRDIWGPSITKTGKENERETSLHEGMRLIVVNKYHEPLGIGRLIDTDFSKNKPAIKMQFDIGDFLRRERKRKKGKRVAKNKNRR